MISVTLMKLRYEREFGSRGINIYEMKKYTTTIQFSTIRQWEQDELRTMLSTVSSLQSHLLSKL